MPLLSIIPAGLIIAAILSRATAQTTQTSGDPGALRLYVADLPAMYALSWEGHEEIFGYKTINGTKRRDRKCH